MPAVSKKRQGPVDNVLPKGGEDPFGGTGSRPVVYKKMIDMMKYHPRVTKKFLPTWLHDFVLVRFYLFGRGPHYTTEEQAVHQLYHTTFDDCDDRVTMKEIGRAHV